MYYNHRYNLIRFDTSTSGTAYKLFVKALYDYVIVKEVTVSDVTVRSYYVGAKDLETNWSNRASLTYSIDFKGRKLVNEGQNWLAAAGRTFTGLLDTYGGAAAAYSLQLLSSDYSGNCVTVRRASDNATLDIGFSNNELDTASLETFCTGTDGFITTWYDQSGNGANATQTTASSQPKIVSSGSVILENSKPAVSFDGVDDTLQYDFSPDEVQPFTSFHVRRYRDVSSTYVGIGVDSLQGAGYADISVFGQFRSFYGTYLVNGSSNTNQGLWYTLGNGTNSEIGLDSNTAITGNAGTGGLKLLSIGSAAGIAYFAPINTQSVIIYTNNQSSNRTGIETALNDYYNIF